MNDFDILGEMIRREARIDPEPDVYGKKISVTLSEPQSAEHPGYEVTIRGMPEQSLVIKADRFPPPQAIFNNTRMECKRADFVIFATNGKGRFIVFIEMKRGKGDGGPALIAQLKGASCCVDYCRAIGQTFWNNSEFLERDGYAYRFINIRYAGLNKRPTRHPSSSGRHDTPERALKLRAPQYLTFSRLIGSA